MVPRRPEDEGDEVDGEERGFEVCGEERLVVVALGVKVLGKKRPTEI